MFLRTPGEACARRAWWPLADASPAGAWAKLWCERGGLTGVGDLRGLRTEPWTEAGSRGPGPLGPLPLCNWARVSPQLLASMT